MRGVDAGGFERFEKAGGKADRQAVPDPEVLAAADLHCQVSRRCACVGVEIAVMGRAQRHRAVAQQVVGPADESILHAAFDHFRGKAGAIDEQVGVQRAVGSHSDVADEAALIARRKPTSGGTVASPTPMVPMAADSTSVMRQNCGSRKRLRKVAVTQSAVPPPAIRMFLMGCGIEFGKQMCDHAG